MADTTDRVTVKVERDLYDQIKAYSDATGVPVSRVVSDALESFASTKLQGRLKALTK